MDQELYSLIGKAQTGDKEAFALLVKRYKETLFRYAYGMLSDRMEAEDVAQEALIKAYYSLPNLGNIYAFSSWLSRIVSHLCYDRIHKRKRTTIAAGELIETHGSNHVMEQTELHLAIHEAMKQLSPEHREAIVLRDVQGYSYEEIAGMLQIPLGTVKSRISAARLLLRKEMNRETGD